MGCGQSKAKPPVGGRAFPAPLPPPMQDNMNEILNRWRHGEVNLLQRRFRLARAQTVKNKTIASKIRGLGAPPSNSGTTTSASTSANNEASLIGADDSASPESGVVGAEVVETNNEGGESAAGSHGGGVGADGEVGVGVGVGERMSLGDVGGSARAGMDREAFLRVFPAVQGLPVEVQQSAFRLFDCVGRGSLDFRNFCRALALCCRGSREERLRFLFDLFSAPRQPKHYGTGAYGGPRFAPPVSSGGPVCVSEAELTALKKHLGLSSGDADHTPFHSTATIGSEGRSGSPGLLLMEFFEWAEANVSDEALDRALRPFYLLPSPQQEKDKVLTQLTKYTTEEGQWMYLVAATWWRYWCNYAGLTREDFQRVPEASALGLTLTQRSEHSAARGDLATVEGAERIGTESSGGNGYGYDFSYSGAKEGSFQGGQGQQDALGVGTGGGKERAVPTMLARRPHEIDNSSLQGDAEWEVVLNLELGEDYVLLPKAMWDVMMDWYGGGPVFCRRVVKVSTPSLLTMERDTPTITIKKGAADADDARNGITAPADNVLLVDLYPLALHVSFCDASGRSGGRDRLVLTSHHVTVKDMLSEVLHTSRFNGMQRPFTGLSGAPIPSADEGEREGNPEDGCGDTLVEQWQGGEQGQTSGEETTEGSPDNLEPIEQERSIRLWVLELIPSGLLDLRHAAVPGPSASRSRYGVSGAIGVAGVGGVDQTGGLKRWKLIKAEEEVMPLSALGFVGGDKVMLETKLEDGTWPRYRYIEEPNFRDFREGDRLDAMDYQGRWFRGQVVDVGYKSLSRIAEFEGPVGRKKKSRPRSQQSASQDQERDRDRERPERIEATESNGARSSAPVMTKTGSSGSNSGGSSNYRNAGMSKSSSSTSSISKAVSGSVASKSRGVAGEVDVNASATTSASAFSRKRMAVRVRFDRFAPQWDEWYDSKSVKLAPEASYTAPPVSTHSVTATGTTNVIIKPNKTRDEGTPAEGEAEEEASPTASSNKPGATTVNANGSANASSNPPKGGAYPPPVGRLQGDASSGNSWNTRLLNPVYGPPRGPNGTVSANNTDGISNYVGVALNRKNNTPGKPPIPGACGLVNVGNTCYLNSAIQCLSHTPLLRAYLLSDMWEAEVNKYNPLGTQGKLVEDFASLLKSLWSQEFLCFFPSKFKRGLIKYKSQFAGNEQQDSQEFLAVMLDALHEDVNRVIEKPYQADAGEAEPDRSDQELADEAWNGHVQRNRSVIVDLFQGQLKMECRCPVCEKKSVTFDPFMYLSVPIPTRNEKMLRLILLPRIRTKDIIGNASGSDIPVSSSEGEAAEFSNPRRLVPVQYGMMLPRLGEVIDLKRELSDLSGISPSALVIANVSQHHARTLGDREPLTSVREDDSIFAYVVENAVLRKRPRGQVGNDLPAGTASSNGRTGPESVEAISTSTSTSTSAISSNGTTSASERGEGGGKDSSTKGKGREDGSGEGTGESVGDAADAVIEEIESTDLDDDRPHLLESELERQSPDERCMQSFPTSFRDLEIGWRLDALDKEGGWYPSTIINMSEGSGRSSKSSSTAKTGRQIKVHFDGFMSKWDEVYGEQDWKDGKLAILYSKSNPDERATDIQVVHRKITRVQAPSAQSVERRTDAVSSGDGQHGRLDGGDGKDQSVVYAFTKDLCGLPFVIRCPPNRSARYLWRLVVQQASRFVAGSYGSSKLRGTRSKDKMAKAAAGASITSKRTNVTAAWVARAAVGLEKGISDEKLFELLPFTVKFVLRNNPLSDSGSVELLPDRWKAASSLICNKLILALDWKDFPRDYLDVETSTFDHPSYLELENNAQSAQSGLTLEQCLDAYTREETLGEEDSWFCSGCKAHRRGVMKIDLWKMPDVLVMHMKRFQCSARWREKIRTLVVFPHSGLDMSAFVSANSAHRNQVGGGQGGMVYDLFGVVNHVGGMTGGHYTAYCRSSPCTKDGVEEVTGWGMEHPWLHFDDEFVEEIAPDKIVSEAAYVLFYRRRRLTPSNVINMTI